MPAATTTPVKRLIRCPSTAPSPPAAPWPREGRRSGAQGMDQAAASPANQDGVVAQDPNRGANSQPMEQRRPPAVIGARRETLPCRPRTISATKTSGQTTQRSVIEDTNAAAPLGGAVGEAPEVAQAGGTAAAARTEPRTPTAQGDDRDRRRSCKGESSPRFPARRGRLSRPFPQHPYAAAVAQT